jgi:hypothetical protein
VRKEEWDFIMALVDGDKEDDKAKKGHEQDVAEQA